MAFPSHAANPALYASLPYDSEKDFAPISMVTKVSEILLVPNPRPRNRSRNSSRSRARNSSIMPRSASEASRISQPSFSSSMAGVKMTHIPYRSVPQAQQAVMTGEVAAFFDTPVTALPQIRAGTRAGARHQHRQTARGRAGYPTIAEAGVPGYEVIGLERRAGAGQYTAAHYRQTQQGHRGGAQDAGNGANCSQSKASSPPATARKNSRGRCMPISKNGYASPGKPASNRNRRKHSSPREAGTHSRAVSMSAWRARKNSQARVPAFADVAVELRALAKTAWEFTPPARRRSGCG